MNYRSTWIVGCLFLPSIVLAADALNVKPGLWEIASETQMSGVPPLPKEMLEQMTPEQRAKMQADIEAASAGTQKEVSRECITQKDLQRPFESADAKNCTQTIVATTSSSQEVRLQCTGQYQGAGLFRIQTPTPETMNGTLDLKMGEGTETMTIKSQLKGKWLGSDCGEEAGGAENDQGSDSDDDVADEAPGSVR